MGFGGFFWSYRVYIVSYVDVCVGGMAVLLADYVISGYWSHLAFLGGGAVSRKNVILFDFIWSLHLQNQLRYSFEASRNFPVLQ